MLGDVLALHRDVPAFEGDVLAFDKDAPAFDEDVSAFDKDVSAFDENVPTFEGDVPAFDRDVSPFGEDVPALNGDVFFRLDFVRLSPAVEKTIPANRRWRASLVARGESDSLAASAWPLARRCRQKSVA